VPDSYDEWPQELRSSLEELFRAGPPLTETQQIGRTPVIAALAERLRSGEIKKLFEPRRVGKTTVARGALSRFRALGGVEAEVNLAIYRKPEEVASELASRLAAGMTAPAAARVALRRLTGALSPARGEVGDDAGAILELAEQLLGDGSSPARVLLNAQHHARKKLAVFLDEAHVISDWAQDEQEGLGAALRSLGSLGVIIASSERRALESLSAEGGPLQFVGDRYTLPSIADADWRAELPRRFARLGVPITTPALDMLLRASGGQPYCTMMLARESAIAAIGAGGADRCSDAHVQVGLLVATRDEAWDELT